MNLIKLLFKLRKNIKQTDDRPDGSVFMRDGSLELKDCKIEATA